jgi:two-component system, sensor histidine kinase and response regulator
MVELGSEHQELLQFLYAAPVGLVHASAAGDIEMINSASARWLLPLAPDGKLVNLFTALATVAPGLREAVASRGQVPGSIVDHLRIEVTGGRQRLASPEFVSLTLTRVDDNRLMAVLNDITQQVRDERALGDSEAHYRAVVSVLSEGIVVHDPGGRLLMCNAAADRIVGAPLPPLHSDKALAKGWATLWHDGRPMSVADTPTGIVLAGGPAQEDVPVFSITPSGEKRWFEVSAQPVIRPGTTELLAVVTSFTDVTQRQKLQEELHHHREHLQDLVTQRTRELEVSNAALSAQQRLYRAVADAVPGMIGYWDAELRCRFSNSAYLEWFGMAPEAMVGMRMQDLLGEDLFARNRPHVEAALRGEPQHFQRSIRKHDGSIGHTLASYIPDIADGRVRGFNVVVSDVTELKQAELRLASLNDQLQQRALQADEATKAKSAFLANMSHEIRTPMNAIIGLSHLMRREAHDPQQLSRLRKIDDASQHLLQLINNILDLSKIEAGKMPLDDAEFDTHELLSRSIGMVSNQAREKSLQIALDCDALPLRLRGDAVRLSQCLINLLSNAVKFTQRGWIRLRGLTEFADRQRVLVRFEVQDTGPGIAADRLPALFNAFEQADNSSTRQHAGTGLGLALTRHFARLMGGAAGVTSELGAGSTFWFTASLSVVADAGDEAPAKAFHGLRALLMNDLPDALADLTRSLGALGLEVDAQQGSADGLRQLDAAMAAGRPYDVVLVERAMRPADGIDVLNSIRQRLGEGTPACLLTTTDQDDTVERLARDVGFDAVLVQPITLPILERALGRALRQPRGAPGATAALASTNESDLRRKFAGRRVLLVEDNPINREIAVELLELVGLDVEVAGDGAHAVETMRARHFDMVLMDVQMPVMDGLTATREIRQRGTRTPILALTANAFGEERAACLAAGMNDHVAKPVNPALLYDAILRWLPTAASAVGDATSEPSVAGSGGEPDKTPLPLLERLSGVRGLDTTAALRTVGGKVGVLERVLLRFTEVYAAGQGEWAFERETPSVARLMAITHSLRGACAAVGLQALHVELARFEQELAKEPDPLHHMQRVRALSEQLNQVIGQLKAALSASTDRGTPAGS